MMKKSELTFQQIEHAIFTVRGHKVMLDSDLAEIYGVSVKVLNQAVKRNQVRFPHDFCFQLNNQEYTILRSQIVTLKTQVHGKHKKYLPHVFTEHGAVMLSNLLKTETAIHASIQVVRAFIKLREMANQNQLILKELEKIKNKVTDHDVHIQALFHAIQRLIEPSKKQIRKIGFERERDGQKC